MGPGEGTKALGGLLIGTLRTICCYLNDHRRGRGITQKNILRMAIMGEKDQRHIKLRLPAYRWGSYKDTAGPAVSPLIKIINIVALLCAVI